MKKYYRVIKDTFLWEKGAILVFDSNLGNGKGGYSPIEDIWNIGPVCDEYITAPIIEQNPEWFERVYESNIEKFAFKTVDEMKKIYNKLTN